jgi:hypothetical protein
LRLAGIEMLWGQGTLENNFGNTICICIRKNPELIYGEFAIIQSRAGRKNFLLSSGSWIEREGRGKKVQKLDGARRMPKWEE